MRRTSSIPPEQFSEALALSSTRTTTPTVITARFLYYSLNILLKKKKIETSLPFLYAQHTKAESSLITPPEGSVR